MKTNNKTHYLRCFGLGITPALILALTALCGSPASAGESEVAYISGSMLDFQMKLVPPNPGGMTHVRAFGAGKFLSSNPLVNGLQEWEGLVIMDEELNFLAQGTFTITLGIWDGTTFTPSAAGGVWKGTWHSTGSFLSYTQELRAIAHGIAGEVKGMLDQAEGTGSLDQMQYTVELLDPHAKK